MEETGEMTETDSGTVVTDKMSDTAIGEMSDASTVVCRQWGVQMKCQTQMVGGTDKASDTGSGRSI